MNFGLTQLYSVLTKELQSWMETAVKLLPNLVLAIFVIVIFYYLAKLGRSIGEKLLGRVSSDIVATRILGSAIYALLFLTGLFITLSILDLDKAVTSLLAGAGVLGLVIGFAFQELSANFISGIFIAFKRPFRVGDVIEVSGYLGTVVKINLRASVIRTFEGQDVYIPNKTLLIEPVANYTHDSRRLLQLDVRISYAGDLETVEALVLEALTTFEGCDYPEETKVYFREFGESPINFVVRYWINFPGNQNHFLSTHSAIKKIKTAFDREGIKIPFPIRSLDLGIEPTKSILQGNSLPKTN